jgi:hypothetical protein
MAHLKNLKSLLQSGLAILEQCVHLALTEKIPELAAILLSFNKCVDFVEGPYNSCQYQAEFFSSKTSNILCELSNVSQHTWWQFRSSVGIDVNHQNCIQQLVSLFQ